ncbi:MAG: hypothetical protein QF752_08485 [Planctomycetota bacterium]|jgi:hypothetical protein|nr:hypothetical protein [Planctomycetota bacterium]
MKFRSLCLTLLSLVLFGTVVPAQQASRSAALEAERRALIERYIVSVSVSEREAILARLVEIRLEERRSDSKPGSGLSFSGKSDPLLDKKSKSYFGTDENGSNAYERSGSRVYVPGLGWHEKPERETTPDERVSVELGVTKKLHDERRELSEYETESSSDYRDREDWLKGRSGVRFGTFDTKATAGAKWDVRTGEVSVGADASASVSGISGAAEGRAGNEYVHAGGRATGTVGKAYAKGSARIGNSEDFAGAKVEAGVGASVLEGTVAGSFGSDWMGLEVEGTLTGSLLTAEAKGVASAGYNKEEERFEIELGGKIGALLAGGGANVKIKLKKPSWWSW